MTDDTYFSFESISEGLYKEKGSKFLAFAYPVETEEEIKELIEGLRKKYYDARHHCYAWILGREKNQFRANDDGEPNHSAGDPILGQLRSNNLTNALIVVVRYFGGTKLGVGGLINAYKTAASDAIANNRLIEKVLMKNILLTFEYLDMNEVMGVIKDFGADIKEQQFDNVCSIKLSVREKNTAALQSKLKGITSVKIV